MPQFQEMPVPDAPVTPAATPSAPASTPSAPSTPPVDTSSAPSSAPVSTPAVETPSAEPVVTPPASDGTITPDGGDGGVATQGREPQQSDFPGDVEGFLKARYAWERGEKVELPDAVVKPEDQAQTPPDDNQQPNPDDEIQVIDDGTEGYDTPQAFQEAIDATPGLKEIMDANPAVKNRFAAMARQNERLRPLGEIFPNAEAAQYANETANTFVGLRASIMMASDTEEMKGAFQEFTDQFKIVDAEGKPVLDGQGNPTFGEDFDLFMKTAVTGSLMSRVEQLKADIEAGKYATEESKENASMRLSAIEFVLEQLDENADDAITREDISGLPENVRKQIEAREAELAKKEEELGIKKAASKKEEVKAARAASQGRFLEASGKTIASQIQTFLDEQKASGAYVPTVVMEYMVDNGHGQKVPIFGKNVLDAYKARINSIPAYRAKLAELQLRPPTPENERERISYTGGLIANELPGILRAELAKMQRTEKSDREKRITDRQAGRKDARVEPQSQAGAPVESQLSTMTDEQAYAKASEQVERDFPNLSQTEKVAKKIELRAKIQKQGR